MKNIILNFINKKRVKIIAIGVMVLCWIWGFMDGYEYTPGNFYSLIFKDIECLIFAILLWIVIMDVVKILSKKEMKEK